MIEIDISTNACPGSVLRVDDCDAALVRDVRWTPDKRRSGLVYAHRKPRGATKQYLHRQIMKPPPGFVVDHIDRDGLNNCRANLRVVTQGVNNWNRAPLNGCASRFKGVHRKRDKWQAEIEGRSIGVFQTEEDAARAFDAAALAAGRDRTGLNFPDDPTQAHIPDVSRPRNEFGFPGVRRLPSGRFGARVIKGGRRISIGSFATAEEASREAKRRLTDGS